MITTAQKHCVTCQKNGGILTCNGCEQTFCGKHVLQHRQNLTEQLDGIMQDHDLLHQELQQSTNEHSLMDKINQWERTSLSKIQAIAEAARVELRQILEKSGKNLAAACNEIAVNLRSSRDADDFCENDLTRWVQQLETLKRELTLRPSIDLIEDEQPAIHFVRVHQNQPLDKVVMLYQDHSIVRYSPNLRRARERFATVIGPGKIIDDSLVAKCTSTDLNYAFALGEQYYVHGEQTIKLKIGRAKPPYNIFLGCVSSQITSSENKIHYYSPFTVGWFGCDEIYQHGAVNYNVKAHGYKSEEILSNDVLQLTFDCERRQLELFHERTNKHHTLSVNIDEAPLPWKFLVVLNRQNDYVRILPS